MRRARRAARPRNERQRMTRAVTRRSGPTPACRRWVVEERHCRSSQLPAVKQAAVSEAQPRARRICYAVADSIINEGERRASARRRCLSVSYFGLAFVKQINQTDRCPVERRKSRATVFFAYAEMQKNEAEGVRSAAVPVCLEF